MPKKRPPRKELSVSKDPAPLRDESAGVSVSNSTTPRDLITAVGLGILIFLRPFRDGVTWEYDNFYFLWGIIVLFTVWGIRAVLRGENLRFRRHVYLLGAFLCVAALTTLGAVRLDNSYRTLLIWIGHFLLFVLAANALRNRAAVGLVLGTFVACTLVEAIYALVHYHYVLPYVRQRMIQDPNLLLAQFGTTELSPDLAHRLNVKRAFGSLLFANALAAFLVLGIPYLAGEAANRLRSFIARRHEAILEPRPGNHRAIVAIVAVFFWFVSLMAALFWYPMAHMIRFGNYFDWSGHLWEPIVFLGVLPLAIAFVPGYMLGRYGLRVGWTGVWSVFLPIVMMLSLLTLWLTFSRGGFLALAMAVTVGVLLVWWSGRKQQARREDLARIVSLTALVLAGLTAVWCGNTGAQPSAPSSTAVAQTPTPLAPSQPASQDAPRHETPRIVPEGVDLTVTDLANPATFWLRLEYWKVGLKIARDHLWSGVGLWNFQTVYAQYQEPDTPPVKEAHNDYLQILGETGIFGFILFTSFWGYFLLWGARRIIEEKNTGERWALIGLYTGILAFLLHSVVDFNFYNPGLAALVFALAGVFLARVGRDTQASRKSHRPVALIVMLVVGALTLGATMPLYAVYFPHRWIGDRQAWVGTSREESNRLEMARTLVQLDPSRYRHTAPVSLPYDTLYLLIPNRGLIERFGRLYVPVGGARRPLNPGEMPPKTGLMGSVVVIEDPVQARQVAMEAVTRRIAILEKAHAYYPYDPDVATHLFQWHDLLRAQAKDAQEAREHILALVKWAERGVALSPHQASFRQLHANALLHRGMAETNGSKRLELLQKALREFEMGTRLAPSSADAWRQYGEAMVRYGEALKKLKNHPLATNADKYIREGQEALEKSRSLPAGT